MPGRYDAIVIGSGFGGSVVCCRLAESGMKVLLLERGRRWDNTTFPRQPGDSWIWNQNNPRKQNGWLDFRVQQGATVAQGAGVGGGSLIYANVLVEAKRSLFDSGWPPEISYSELEPYYERVTRMMQPRIVPEGQQPDRFKTVKRAAELTGNGHRFRPLPIAVTFDPAWRADLPGAFTSERSTTWINEHGKSQGTCIHCGNCYIGCPVHARNTLDLNYIARAETHHAEVRPLHLVRCITPVDGGYRVDFEHIHENRMVAGHETAPHVIVAAGSLGSSELLLRCRDQHKTLPGLSAQLGRRWSPNGDFMTISVQPEPVHPTRGPTITAAIDFLDDVAGPHRFFVQDGGFPEVFRVFFEQGMALQPRNLGFNAMVFGLALTLRRFGSFNHMMPWFAQSMDAADGRLYLGRRWLKPWTKKLIVDWKCSASRDTIEAVFEMQRRLAEATGGKPLVPYIWTMLKTLITPHPLGGGRMGTGADDGVVDHAGRVFGYPNLFVADGSIVPRAIGLNPSKTIAALAERIAHQMTL
jgi:cholesterol oxidase